MRQAIWNVLRYGDRFWVLTSSGRVWAWPFWLSSQAMQVAPVQP